MYRAIGDDDASLACNAGPRRAASPTFLIARHVHAKDGLPHVLGPIPVLGRLSSGSDGRSTGCSDFIRGWLHFCLTAYCELSRPSSRGRRASRPCEEVQAVEDALGPQTPAAERRRGPARA